MALPVHMTLKEALDECRSVWKGVRAEAVRFRAMTLSGATSINDVYGFLSNMRNFRNRLDAARTTPGLSAYAQEQFNEPSYDIVTDFGTFRTAMISCMDDVSAAIPSSGGWHLTYNLVDYQRSPRSFNLTGVAGDAIRLSLDTLIATVRAS